MCVCVARVQAQMGRELMRIQIIFLLRFFVCQIDNFANNNSENAKSQGKNDDETNSHFSIHTSALLNGGVVVALFK